MRRHSARLAFVLAMSTCACGGPLVLGHYNEPGVTPYRCTLGGETQRGACELIAPVAEEDWRRSRTTRENFEFPCRPRRMMVRDREGGGHEAIIECMPPEAGSLGTTGPARRGPEATP